MNDGNAPGKTLEYAPGRRIDIYGKRSPSTLLLWHGRGPNERDVLAPLATLVAGRGVRVLVPDWDSTSPDGGRSDLLRSVKFARKYDAVADSQLVVGGWSLGGTAAASLALNARRLGLEYVPAVCLAGAFRTTDPLSGGPFASILPSPRGPGSIRLIHGTKDDIAVIEGAREFAVVLRDSGWTTELLELSTDHAGIVGTEFDVDRTLCLPSVDPAVREAVEAVADVLVEAALDWPPNPGS
ncbi:MAG: alpha/beta fold hydrolase [Actinomycetota bacterium]|nr:alpha/beta fold hydrolase [Actinomycetota bacterium]